MYVSDIPELVQLSTEEKILLVEDLWDNIALNESNVHLPQSHIEELDRRFERYTSNPGALLSLQA